MFVIGVNFEYMHCATLPNIPDLTESCVFGVMNTNEIFLCFFFNDYYSHLLWILSTGSPKHLKLDTAALHSGQEH